jgi:molecular chaperone GrpE
MMTDFKEPSDLQNQASENETNSEPNGSLQACQQELLNWKERSLRLTADFENYKKRAEKEKAQWVKMAQSAILTDLLNIVDDFDRAFGYIQENPAVEEMQPWLDGFALTHKAIIKLLQKYDVVEIKDHEIFDPMIHEATMQVDSPEHISGAVVAVLQKGYMLKGEVLRPAKVSVAK